MSVTEKQQDDKAKQRPVEIEVDGEELTAPDREQTPRQIVALAGKDPEAVYLVELKGKRKRISYKDNPDDPIKLKKGDRFITVSLGPTPVS